MLDAAMRRDNAKVGVMQLRMHLISGLPRSGSTLLSALLRQNPRFVAGVTSPVAMLCGNLLHGMSGATEFASFFSDEKRRAVMRGVFHSYYSDVVGDRVVFDTNRSWTSRLPLLAEIYPDARIICCVRDIAWILDSIERQVRRHALQPSKLFNYRLGGSIYSRTETLMHPDKGLVGLPWSALREAWFSDLAGRLILISYDSLAKQPARVLARLYDELKEPHFAHDFDKVEYESAEYDAELGLPGLHTVRAKVAPQERATCLPPDLFSKYANTAFWADPRLNARRVTVL